MKKFTWLLPVLLGCPPSVPEDTDSTDTSTDTDTGVDTDTDVEPVEVTVVIATVAADFSVGSLAEVSGDDFSVSDELAPLTSDPAVITDDGKVIVLGRYGFDSVRVYAAGDYAVPETEFSTGEGSNPQDAAICGGDLFVSLYGDDEVRAYNLEGELQGSVSLEAYSDEDGIPEASSMVEIDGVVYVALNILDQDGGFQSAGPGQVVAIDCETRTVLENYAVGPNPSIEVFPGDAGRLLVRTGVYYVPDDGALSYLTLEDGEVHEWVSEGDLEADLTEVASSDAGALLISQDTGTSQYSLWCVNAATGGTSLLGTTFSYINDATVDANGFAWVAAREGYTEEVSVAGVAVYDLTSCEAVNEGDWLSLSLPPYAIATY